MVEVPLGQELDFPQLPQWPDFPEWPDFPWPELNPNTTGLSDSVINKIQEFQIIKRGLRVLTGAGSDRNLRVSEDNPLYSASFNLAVCIPKTCTTAQVAGLLPYNLSSIEYSDSFCRLPNDKPIVAADYVAIGVFGFIGALVILGTCYDINHNVVHKQDPKRTNRWLMAFSVYTNTRRLVTYTPVPGTIECLDGIRSLAMMWVIIGHTFVAQFGSLLTNPLEIFQWITTHQALSMTAGPITVDSFFMISGLLIIYTTANKLSRSKLIRNLHFFYLNRLLRMFPVLAAFILIQTSFLYRVADGPQWENPVIHTHRCRAFWWSTLLHVQNYVNPLNMCLYHSWFLAIDVQLFLLSPLVLFWVLGARKRTAWLSLIITLVLVLVSSTVFNFYMEFPAGPIIPSRLEDQDRFMSVYYVNTLCRASPFVVGMIYGYILHLYRDKKIYFTNVQVAILWLCSAAILVAAVYSTYPIMQFDWSNQIVDSIINSFVRPAWALGVGWIVLACHQGYGGPINWLLSLQIWKVPSRLSYGMYIVHYSMIFVVNASAISTTQFGVAASLFKFMSDFSLAFLVAFLLNLLVDAPFSILIKTALGGGPRRPRPPKLEPEIDNNNVSGQDPEIVHRFSKTKL